MADFVSSLLTGQAGPETGNDGYADEKIIRGIPVAPGISYGRACFHENRKSAYTPARKSRSLPDQGSSLTDAFARLCRQLNSLAEAAEEIFDHDTAAIFRAHRMICEEVQTDVLNTLRREQLTVRHAVEKCFDDYSEYFNSLSDDYLSGRASDFTELKNLLLNLLDNTESILSCKDYEGCQVGECALRNEHILVADELTANVAIRIRGFTKGIVTEKCGINSHAAVIARSLGLPVISGIRNPLQLIRHQDTVLMNGATGELILNPCTETLQKYRGIINRPGVFEVMEPVEHIRVLADIDRYKETEKAIRAKADGIGLYRTEFELLDKGRLPGEAEQEIWYRHIVESMAGKPVYIRLFDLGSDKSAPWLQIDPEDNPALGCRGARFLLQHPELIKSQARAIAKVSSNAPVHVIYPMISTVDEFLQLKRIFQDAICDIRNTHLRHGIMFEVPAACLHADELYEVIDFGRIGSNDLVQYLFARDRTGDYFHYDEFINAPALWKLLAGVAEAAGNAGKPLELCGTLVDYPEILPALLELGITTVSTRPENIAAIRKAAMY